MNPNFQPIVNPKSYYDYLYDEKIHMTHSWVSGHAVPLKGVEGEVMTFEEKKKRQSERMSKRATKNLGTHLKPKTVLI